MAAHTDTVFALASGSLPAAIAIIRVSGPLASKIGDQILDKGCPSHARATFGVVLDMQGQKIDEAVVTYFAGPRSYTGEDTLELSLHGGKFLVERISELLYQLGARLAEPGEFTRRAFEAGKLDLTQAEAVADLIDAESEAQHKLAVQQLGGALSSIYDEWHSQLIEALAALEVFIDFPDEGDVGEGHAAPALEILKTLKVDMEATLLRSEGTERLREGFLIAILGAPNAGKSSLLNMIAGHEAAIVTDVPGTTRDFVEIRQRIGPYLVRFSDTAGLRQTDDKVEKVGIARAELRADEADLRLWVAPVGEGWPTKAMSGPKDILVRSKTDLLDDGDRVQDVSRETLQISVITQDGTKDLFKAIEMRLNALVPKGDVPGLTQLRHRKAIESALVSLTSASALLELGHGFELAAEDVRLASQQIAALTGRIDVEEVLGSIFSDFCIGK